MAKKLFSVLIATAFILSLAVSCGIAADIVNEPNAPTPPDTVKNRISRGVNNLFYGPAEVPANMNETRTKGTAVDSCTQKTRSGVERGIARVFTGVWQLATFWNSDMGCVTKAPVSGTKTAQAAASSDIK